MLTEVGTRDVWPTRWGRPSATRSPIPPLIQSLPGHDDVGRLRDPAAQHPPPHGAGRRAQGGALLQGDAADDGRRRARLRPPARRHASLPRTCRSTPARYCYPRVEIEVGFILGADLPGEDCTEEDVLAATQAFAPAIELIDSRIVDWKIGIADTIADNASSAGFVSARAGGAGRHRHQDDRGEPDPQRRAGRAGPLRRGAGQPGDRGRLAGPHGRAFGVRLQAGHVILPGACTGRSTCAPATSSSPTFAGLGDVSLTVLHGLTLSARAS